MSSLRLRMGNANPRKGLPQMFQLFAIASATGKPSDHSYMALYIRNRQLMVRPWVAM